MIIYIPIAEINISLPYFSPKLLDNLLHSSPIAISSIDREYCAFLSLLKFLKVLYSKTNSFNSVINFSISINTSCSVF